LSQKENKPKTSTPNKPADTKNVKAKSSIQVCLVNSEPTLNLTPLFDSSIMPTKVILIFSSEFETYANTIAQAVRPRGIKVEVLKLIDANDIDKTQSQLIELLDSKRDELELDQIALNVSGGSRPVCIAAYEVFRAYEIPIFYVHAKTDHLVWMFPSAKQNFDLEDNIKIETLLAAHGTETENSLNRSSISKIRLEFCDHLIVNIRKFSTPLKTLNWLASSAERTLTTRIEAGHRAIDGMSALLAALVKMEIIQDRGNQLEFKSEADRFFVNGGWLEEFVFNRVSKIKIEKGKLQDCARSVTVNREQRNQKVKNEIDVVFMADNTLHLIECKARSWQGEQGSKGGVAAVYKLDTLTEVLGGLHAKGMIVSYHRFSNADRRRAADLGITICDYEGLANLNSVLTAWIKG